MTRAKHFAERCAVYASVLFFWTPLIGACSRNHVAPAKADKPAASSQSSATPLQTGKSIVNSQSSATSVQPDKAAANSQDTAAPATADVTTTLKNCSQSRKLLSWMKLMNTKKTSFYQYAVRLFNQPIACKGEADGDDNGKVDDDGERKMIIFTFANGATFRIEALPPETGIDELLAPGGFPNEEEARSFIKQRSEEAGVHIDWSQRKERREGDEQVYTYWDPDEGLNAGVDLIYKNKKLVGIGFHMAL